MLYESYSTVFFVIQHGFVLRDGKHNNMDSMCCMSNKALSGVSRHYTTLDFTLCCMGLLTPPSVLYYSYSHALTNTSRFSFCISFWGSRNGGNVGKGISSAIEGTTRMQTIWIQFGY